MTQCMVKLRSAPHREGRDLRRVGVLADQRTERVGQLKGVLVSRDLLQRRNVARRRRWRRPQPRTRPRGREIRGQRQLSGEQYGDRRKRNGWKSARGRRRRRGSCGGRRKVGSAEVCAPHEYVAVLGECGGRIAMCGAGQDEGGGECCGWDGEREGRRGDVWAEA